jgi:rhamnulose-1-phosphate aldolase
MNSSLSQTIENQLKDIASVAGFLWQRGWAERNGGNISVRMEHANTADSFSLGEVEPHSLQHPFSKLDGKIFYVTGTGERMRDVAVSPLNYGLIIRILNNGTSWIPLAGNTNAPTSELVSHLAIHQQFIENRSENRAVLHTHPTELIALTHCPPFLEPGTLTKMLWSMIPETRVFVPRGVGLIPYRMTGTAELARETIKALVNHDVVLWEKHGVLAVGEDILSCFDTIDTLTKSAQIYLAAKMAGFEPQGLSDVQLDELKQAFHLP